jgi:hypothetical protein
MTKPVLLDFEPCPFLEGLIRHTAELSVFKNNGEVFDETVSVGVVLKYRVPCNSSEDDMPQRTRGVYASRANRARRARPLTFSANILR